MWDELPISTLVGLAAAAVTVGIGLGFLTKSKARTTLVVVWTALPFLLSLAANVFTVLDTRVFDAATFFGFTAVFGLLLTPPWALLILLPFNLVRRWREIEAGIDYRIGS
ncbi:putative membrane protein YfhO [Sphingomonas sp. SORGH_AS 950]|uniref:hypothetical protein n=1 Tax=Sphingomonas sp. SORGH_AS_0950 TaxID=3041792 RepID=UPI00278032C1|nr:hypothetical protein [Sphingomonas sp. SORGH_AS_0950]MDQ1159466.1 putative membrane protein YfhO [Sphingomonas sp. SORGH_AS_0950]